MANLKPPTYKSKYFKIEELVDPVTLKELGEEACWAKFRPEVLIGLDRFRELVNAPVTINNWATGGSYKESGVRRKDTPTGSPMSRHKEWDGFDVKVKDMPPKEVREVIKANYLWLGVTRIEADTPTWTHIDFKPVPLIIVPFK